MSKCPKCNSNVIAPFSVIVEIAVAGKIAMLFCPKTGCNVVLGFVKI